MSDRKRVFILILIMAFSSLIVAGITISSLYQTAISEGRERLVETAQSQARLIESVAKFSAIYNESYVPGGAREATLRQLIEAHKRYEQSGRTIEFTLAERKENSIHFLFRHRHGGLEHHLIPISFDSKLAEPMRYALMGKSGTIVGNDYRGEVVLAAHEPVSELGLGIVAKVDLSEIREPFVKAGMIAAFFSFLVVLGGATLFVRISNPMIKLLEEHNTSLEIANKRLRKEIEERSRAERAVRDSEQKYRQLVEQLQEGIWVIDKDANTTFVNPRMAEMIGYTADEMLGKHLFSFMDECGIQISQRNLERRKQGIKEQHDFELLHKNGTRIFTSMETSPIIDKNSDYIGALACVANITARKKTEEKLKRELKVNAALSNLYRPLIAASAKIEDMAQTVLDKAKSLTHSEHGYVSSIEPVSGGNVGHTLSGMLRGQCNVNMEERVAFPLEKDGCYRGLWGYCLNSLEPFFTNSPEKHSASVGAPHGHLPIKRFLSVPILLDEKLVGQIALANKNEDYTQHDLEAIERVAGFYALAIQRIRAEDALQDLTDELETRVEKRTEELKTANIQLIKEVKGHKLTGEKLEQSRSVLQSVVDGISDPLVLLDRNMAVKMLNRAAADYYGLSEYQNILNTKCHQFLRESATPCKGCEIPGAISMGKSLVFERNGFKESDRLENVFIYPVKTGDGESENVLLRISDITEQRLFEKQLIHSEKMVSLGVLVSSIAHEINNPNNFISFNIPILKDYLEEMLPIVDAYNRGHPDFEICNMVYPDFREDIFKLLNNLEHGSDRISTFVSNLKDFSQIKEQVKEEWVDLNLVIGKAVSICRAQLIKRVKTFITNIAENLPRIWSDPYALEQILINLLVNATQASEKKDSRIELSVEVHNSWLNHTILTVRDNGCGMDEKTIQKIFDPFFTTKSQAKGTGLGLYVSHNLVESLRGRIEVESELIKGSIFRVILPDKERRKIKRS